MATISWSGRTWQIADDSYDIPNDHSPGYRWNPNIPKDENGWLHFNLEKINGEWFAPMIYDNDPTGYGTYRTVLQGIHALDKNAVLGLFPYSWKNNHELDIEQAKWGAESNQPWQYTVQPSTETGRRAQVNFSPAMPNSHDILAQIVWTPTGETFLMQDMVTGTILKQWSSDIPVNAVYPLVAKMFINLYPFTDFAKKISYPPATDQHYVIKSFTFTPYGVIDTYYDTFLEAALSEEYIQTGESVTITGNLSTSQVPLPGKQVTFVASNGDMISPATTDANGDFSKEYTPSSAGRVKINAYYAGGA